MFMNQPITLGINSLGQRTKLALSNNVGTDPSLSYLTKPRASRLPGAALVEVDGSVDNIVCPSHAVEALKEYNTNHGNTRGTTGRPKASNPMATASRPQPAQ